MAKRHVNLYFLEVEAEYLQMLAVVKELKRCAEEKIISEEQYEDAAKQVEIIKANYERIGWIMHLLNLPNRKSKEDKALANNWYKNLQYASKEAIIDENKDALCKLKELIKNGELKKNES